VGISGTPSSAQAYIKSEVDFVTQKAGGQGAFREFVESIIGIQEVKKILEILA
jgi:3-deoxy-D-manno-octulosonate 8-phosphate phosphatase (KDO 8-P phosphatase)